MHQPHEAARVADWIRLTAAGDQVAFTELYRATRKWLLAVAWQVNAAHAEDAVAETFLQVWRNAASYDESRGPPFGWLATVVRSRALDQLRRDRAARIGQSVTEGDSTDGECPQPRPDDSVASRQEARRLHAALATLSARERDVIGLAYFHERSQSEIAVATALPLGTVKTVTRRALPRLRRELGALRDPVDADRPSAG